MKTIDKNLLIDCSSVEEADDVFDYLESQGEKTSRTSFGFSSTEFGNKVISAKEFLGKEHPYMDNQIRLALPHELVQQKTPVKSFPTKWCLRITNENIQVLDAWRRQQPGFYNKIDGCQGWLISDKNDGTYTNWSESVPHGYTEITYEEFVTNVHSIVLYNTTTKGFEDAFEHAFKDLVTSGSLPYYSGIDPYEKEKPLIEDVQSIDVNLRTKKQINKLKF